MFLRFQNWLSDFDLLAYYIGMLVHSSPPNFPFRREKHVSLVKFRHIRFDNGTKNSPRYRLNPFFAVCVQWEQQNQQHENASLFCYWWDWIILFINSVFSSILIRTYFYYVNNTITCHTRDRIRFRSPLYFARSPKSFYFKMQIELLTERCFCFTRIK